MAGVFGTLPLLLLCCSCFIGVVQGQVICFTTDPSINPGVRCGGLRVFPNPPTVRECCLGNGFFYRLSAGDETCFECVVFGWLNGSTFEGHEQWQSYELLVGYAKGPVTNRLFRYTLGITTLSTPPPVLGSDFTVLCPATLRPRTTRPETVQVTFFIDSVALEPRESFQLRLLPGNTVSRPQAANEFLLEVIELTIIDFDVVVVQFGEDHYRARETQLRMPVWVTKNKVIATSLVVQVIPMNVSAVIDAGLPLPAHELRAVNVLEPNRATSFPEENKDFSTEPVNITFSADEGDEAPERTIFIPIVNDGVDEAIEEKFIVLLTLLDASNRSSVNVSQPARISSVCRIVDVDDIRIGFEREVYTFQEVENQFPDTIVLIKENNRSTERTFSVVIEVGNACPSGISANTEFGVDYTAGHRVQTLRFIPTVQRLPIAIQIFGDELPEGTEAFLLQSRNSNSDPRFDTPPRIAFANTFVVIEDDDTPQVTLKSAVTEVYEGNALANFTVVRSGDTQSNVTVFFGTRQLSSEDAAVAGVDYVAINVTVIFLPGQTTQEVHVPLAEDDIYPEANKTFEVYLAASPGVYLSRITHAVVTILNDDPYLPAAPPESTTSLPENTTAPPESATPLESTTPPESSTPLESPTPPESTAAPPESTTSLPEITTVLPESNSAGAIAGAVAAGAVGSVAIISFSIIIIVFIVTRSHRARHKEDSQGAVPTSAGASEVKFKEAIPMAECMAYGMPATRQTRGGYPVSQSFPGGVGEGQQGEITDEPIPN